MPTLWPTAVYQKPGTHLMTHDIYQIPTLTLHVLTIFLLSSRIWDMSIPFNVWMWRVKHSYASTNSIIWFRIFLPSKKENTYAEHQKRKYWMKTKSTYIIKWLCWVFFQIFKAPKCILRRYWGVNIFKSVSQGKTWILWDMQNILMKAKVTGLKGDLFNGKDGRPSKAFSGIKHHMWFCFFKTVNELESSQGKK